MIVKWEVSVKWIIFKGGTMATITEYHTLVSINHIQF